MLNRLKQIIPNWLKRAVRRFSQNVWESILYRLTSEQPSNTCISHVVFICKGNICRSAFAEYYLKSLVTGGPFIIESCGLDVDQGIFSPPEAVKAAKEFGLDLGTHFSKGLAVCDLNNADLILPMEYRHYLRLTSMFPEYKGKIQLLRDFDSWPHRLLRNIYDPFGLGEGEFSRCFSMMQKSLDGLQYHLARKRA